MTRARTGPGAVRISAGRWKGRRLEVPPGARPTAARAREALFDILGERVAGARFLDLHAGSGAVGFEAVSRGAARAVLVDLDVEAMRSNAERLSAGDTIEILASDADRAIRFLGGRGESFDVVFSDPPYAGAGEGAPGVSEAGEAARASGLVAVGGILVLQRDAGPDGGSPPVPSGFTRLPQRRYGRNVFEFFARTSR